MRQALKMDILTVSLINFYPESESKKIKLKLMLDYICKDYSADKLKLPRSARELNNILNQNI
jgi:hypothetical protein